MSVQFVMGIIIILSIIYNRVSNRSHYGPWLGLQMRRLRQLMRQMIVSRFLYFALKVFYKFGLNAIYGYHSARAISHDVVTPYV